METQCNAGRMEFHGLGARRVVGRFDGGRISSDGGSVLLREVESRTHILKRLAGCFIDHRDPELIEHSVESLIEQRVYGMALGYEDLNDHDTLRHDVLLGVLGGKEEPSGAGRRQADDRGKALAEVTAVELRGTTEGPMGPLRSPNASCGSVPCHPCLDVLADPRTLLGIWR